MKTTLFLGIAGVILIGSVFGSRVFLQKPVVPYATEQSLEENAESPLSARDLADRMAGFIGKAVSENLQDQVREADNPLLAPNREPCSGDQATVFSCYDNLYAAIVAEDGVEQAFAFLRKEYQSNDYARAQCHQITHIIGRAAARKFQSVFEAYGAGDGFCWSGYYHGVMENIVADIGAARLHEKLGTVCKDIAEQRRYSFDHYNCVHGLGHGIMAIAQNELFESLKTCDILQDSWDRSSCWSGAFMENIMADQRNHVTQYLKPEDPLYPCNAVEPQYKGTCYLMQTSYMLKINGRDFAKTFSWCANADKGFQEICYQSVGRDASGGSLSDKDSTKAICLLGQNSSQRSNCVIGAVKDFISYFHGDAEAKELCAAFEDQELRDTCFSTAREYVKVL